MSGLLKVTHMPVTFNNKKRRPLFSFHTCYVLSETAAVVIIGSIIDG